MIVAFMRSESFDWIAYGDAELEAKEAIISEWNQFFGDNETLGGMEYPIVCYDVKQGCCLIFDKAAIRVANERALFERELLRRPTEYDNARSSFGVVRWYDEDLADKLREYGYTASEEQIATIKTQCSHHFFTDHMIEAGWNTIEAYIEEKELELRAIETQHNNINKGDK